MRLMTICNSSPRKLTYNFSFFKLKIMRYIYTMKHAAAAAAKLCHSCPTLCDPIDGSPPGSSVPGILQARMKHDSAIKRHTSESVLMRWMNLEPVIQSEVCQEEKDKYEHMYMKSRKLVLTNLSAGQQWR